MYASHHYTTIRRGEWVLSVGGGIGSRGNALPTTQFDTRFSTYGAVFNDRFRAFTKRSVSGSGNLAAGRRGPTRICGGGRDRGAEAVAQWQNNAGKVERPAVSVDIGDLPIPPLQLPLQASSPAFQ